MTSSTSISGFPVPLTSKAWNIAQKQVQPQFDADHNQQQFRNGLAVYAVDFYLKCMAFEVEPRHNSILSQLLEGADLVIKDMGRLECCPVRAGETTFQVPVDAWCDRIAYIMVQIEDHLEQAQILGFHPQPVPPSGKISLSQLQPIEAFPQYLHESQTTVLTQVWAWAREQRNALAESAVGAFYGWQRSLTLAEMSLATRSVEEQKPQLSVSDLRDQVLVSKAIQLQDLNVEVIMALSPKAEGRFKIELVIEAEQPLPSHLQLAVVDAAGQTFQQLSPTSRGDLMPRPFSAVPGERFCLQLSYGEAEHVENFVI